MECAFAVPYTKTALADGFGDAACMGGGQGLVSNRAKCEFANFKWGNFKWHNAQNRRPNLKVDKEGPGICGSSSRMPRCHDTTAGQHGHDGRPAPATKMGSILA